MAASQKYTSSHGILISLPDRSLNHGSNMVTIPHASKKEKKTINTDSLKNWNTSCHRLEPIVFLMPTSLARLAERAVLRLIKLMHANSNTKHPTIPTIHTILTGLSSVIPFAKGNRCQRFMGCKNSCGCLATCSSKPGSLDILFNSMSLIAFPAVAKSLPSGISVYTLRK